MIESLLGHDRVCLRAGELRDQLTEELEYVASLGDDIFQRLASCVAVPSGLAKFCLLYTTDAADELPCANPRGTRSIT